MQDKKKLLLGTAKVDITPDSPVFLAGFYHRKGKSVGVKSNLYSRISVFVDPENMDNKFLLIQADLIWFGNELVEKYKKIISGKYNIPGSAIVFHASHTHSGPQTTEKFSKLLGVYESGCVEGIMNKILSGIDTAMDNIEEVNIFRGTGNCDIGINRRKV